MRENLEWMKHLADEPVDRLLTYIGSPNLFLRSKLPLNLIIPPSEAENPALEVPYFRFDPISIGGDKQHRHIANIPGNKKKSYFIVNKDLYFRRSLGQYSITF